MKNTCGAGCNTAGRLSIGLFLSIAALSYAGETKSWLQSDYSDFEKGTIKNLSLRSDGLVTLAPQFREVFDSSSAYLWPMSHDSAGNLYSAGAPDAPPYRISPRCQNKP